MIGLDEAKAIIHGADPDLGSEQYSEIRATIVFEAGWRHLGDDYFYNDRKKLVAGPSAGSPIRILADLRERNCTRATIDFPYEVCNGMGKEAWRHGIIGF